mmetsp:Transcript_35739/g.43142  ORF Transcript_35739/g.43142 Transcript_35739/m.43142 type:complete len:285 (-) Transcript_35739:537-1391(-)|eukprot:CAMPEP_0197847932 /NCGR_PEP_ID=MMETSP1438-20131217/7527_1 /TAXON_ID=1461541 /ORGANISM="Pterosperma sp., Strain CCMP1384" /LENGTH=284 /DNA_ID=CAMNT_0043460013 /DNA_START=222 /DNA_END=1076 /DNA_ORIENTATION=+
MPFISDLTGSMDILSGSGIVLSSEQKAVVEHSLPLKKMEASLAGISLWGKLTTLNGKDYLIAKGTKSAPYVFEGKAVVETKIYYSQDCVKWLDLAPVDEETYARALTISGFLTGEPGHQYVVEEPAPEPEPTETPAEEAPAEDAPPPAEGEDGEAEGPEPLRFNISESARLRTMVENISGGTDVMPIGYCSVNAKNQLLPNVMFAGVSFPDKLESYQHGFMGAPLSKDVNGCWSMQFDSFKGTAILRSLMYPGYVFCYSAEKKSFDSFYQGTGESNKDMMFMLA